jgi:hypothetical protein
VGDFRAKIKKPTVQDGDSYGTRSVVWVTLNDSIVLSLTTDTDRGMSCALAESRLAVTTMSSSCRWSF